MKYCSAAEMYQMYKFCSPDVRKTSFFVPHPNKYCITMIIIVFYSEHGNCDAKMIITKCESHHNICQKIIAFDFFIFYIAILRGPIASVDCGC